MAGRIKNFVTRFSECHTITNSIRQSLRFALMKTGSGLFSIKLNNRGISLRRNKTDRDVFISTFLNGYHRCPFILGNSPTIVDFGANIGLTIIDFKEAYPNARIFGAELDKKNYETCLLNIKGFSNCNVLQKAIWKTEETVAYGGNDEQSFSIISRPASQIGTTSSITVDNFFKFNNLLLVDYLKMDIEGAEYAVLIECDSKKWLQKTRYLSIEVHDTETLKKEAGISQLTTVLENNGFMVYKSSLHWSSLLAVNKSLLNA